MVFRLGNVVHTFVHGVECVRIFVFHHVVLETGNPNVVTILPGHAGKQEIAVRNERILATLCIADRQTGINYRLRQ